jgi:methyl-accepting chemotaxis protein
MNAVVDDSVPGTYAAGRLDSLQLDLRGATLHHVATPDPKTKAVKDAQSATLASQAAGILKQYEVTVDEARDRALFQPIPGLLDAYIHACEKVRAFSREGKTQEAMHVYDTEGDASRKRLKDAIKELIQYNQTSAKENAQATRSATRLGLLWTFLVLSLVLVAGGLLAFFSIRDINAALRRSIGEIG